MNSLHNNHLLRSPDSENGSASVVAPENPPTEAVRYEVEEFIEGTFKGFKFVAPEYGNLGAAIDTYGESTVLSILNSALLARIRTKVKNSLTLYTKDVKAQDIPKVQAELLQKYPGGMLFTQEDATKWRPEVRELTPNQLFKQAKLAFSEGRVADGQKLLMEMSKCMGG